MIETGDYISREAAEEVFRDARKSLNAQKYDYMANEYLTRDTMLLNAEQIIHALPAADVRPVKRGKWIIDRAFGNDVMSNEQMVICSACHKGIFWGKQNFCPNCGAEMREADNG